MVGRPTEYNKEITYLICERIAGGESLKKITDDADMPARSTIYKWLDENVDFSDRYTRAKEDCADYMVEEMLEIADDGTNDYNERFDKDGEIIGWQLNNEHVNRSRLRVDTRKWIAAKLKPVKYSDRIQQEIQTPKPLQIESVQVLGVNAQNKDT